MSKPKILFVYDHEYPEIWKDGLWAALNLLEQDFVLDKVNLYNQKPESIEYYDCILGWGAFGSKVDGWLKWAKVQSYKGKIGLCIAGNAHRALETNYYDVLFYETDWYKPQIENHPNIVKAFGVNTDIFHPIDSPKIWDYLTVGAFAYWKRQERMVTLPQGPKFAIGQIQRGNIDESTEIIGTLLSGGVAISDMVAPEVLAKIYNASKIVYIPADINGGGERAVWEAKACGCKVEIEPDNPKLEELVNQDHQDHHFYAEQLKKGILSCL